MILTITLSPTFDLTYSITSVTSHEVNRAGKKEFEPSGKGINVSVNLAEEKFETIAVAPVPTNGLGQLWINLANEKIIIRTSKSSHDLRINTSIVDTKGVTKINEEFEKLDLSELQDLITTVEKEVNSHKPSWIALCGSVHPDNAVFLGENLRRICDQANIKLAIDTSGKSAKVLFDYSPDFVKPNRDELAEWFPESKDSIEAYLTCIQNLAKKIDGTVLCTDGGKTAYATNNENLLEIVPPTIAGVNSVGAGDASLAGYLAAESSGSDFVTAIKMAMTWAIASCQNSKTAGLNLKAANGAIATIKELAR